MINHSQPCNFSFLRRAVDAFDLRARSFQVPGVSIWNEPARSSETDRCKAV